MKRCLVLLLVMISLLTIGCAQAENKLTVLFTSDIHSWFNTGVGQREGELHEHGGAGRLSTLLAQNDVENCILVDAGDFAMGTLLQSGYTTDAYELRLLGRLGYTATTFGNHEFDPGAVGAASMIRAAVASGDPLPVLLTPANLELTGELTPAAQDLANALREAGSSRYILRNVNGVRVAVFGLMGNNAVLCTSERGVTWANPIEAAQRMVKEIGDQADVIICVSHGGTDGTGKAGEDVELVSKVPGIDVVISGHAHVPYHDAVIVRKGTVLGSCGSFMTWLGRMDLTVLDDGSVQVDDYRLLPIDETVESDPSMDAVVEGYWQEIAEGYLSDIGYTAEQVIAHADFTLDDKPVREEVPLGSLIADSYLYACRNAGLEDVDVAIVGMGTVRAPLLAGDITTENAFEVCSLGFGEDNSPGHPLISAWIRGGDLKLITEMDALIGPIMSEILMNFAGLEVEIDVNRMPLDRVTSINIVRADGTREPLRADRMYRVVANLYAVNMLGNICDMAYGLVDLSPMDQNGVKIPRERYYDYAVTRKDGAAVKEWVALCSYLAAFEPVNGIPQIPERYRISTGRKQVSAGGFLDVIKHPGASTLVVMLLAGLLILLAVYLVLTHKKRKARRAAKKAAKAEKKAQKK